MTSLLGFVFTFFFPPSAKAAPNNVASATQSLPESPAVHYNAPATSHAPLVTTPSSAIALAGVAGVVTHVPTQNGVHVVVDGLQIAAAPVNNHRPAKRTSRKTGQRNRGKGKGKGKGKAVHWSGSVRDNERSARIPSGERTRIDKVSADGNNHQQSVPGPLPQGASALPTNGQSFTFLPVSGNPSVYPPQDVSGPAPHVASTSIMPIPSAPSVSRGVKRQRELPHDAMVALGLFGKVPDDEVELERAASGKC